MRVKNRKKSNIETLGFKLAKEFKSGKIIDKLGSGFDVVSTINKLTPENIEFHIKDEGDDGVIRKASFCGPNTNLKKRLINYESGTGKHDGIQPWSEPINALDRGCYNHDIAYSKYKDINNRHKADQELIKVAEEVLSNPNSTDTQKFNANLVKIILKGKVYFGIGYNIQQGGNLDVNQLISQAQKQASSSSFDSSTPVGAKIIGTLIPLIILASSIGIPALINKYNKNKKGSGMCGCEYDDSSEDY